MLRVDSISTRIEKVEVLIEEGKNVKRLRILEKTLDTAYAALEKNNNTSNDDEDSDDDDDDGDESEWMVST